MRALSIIIILIFTSLLVVSCEQQVPTPEFVLPSPSNTAVPPTSTIPPTRVPTNTPAVTNTPERPTPTATSLPTQTPIPQVVIEVLNGEDSQPVVGASVRLSQEARGYDANFQTLEDGTAIFVGLVPSNVPYLAEVTFAGYRPVSMELTVAAGENKFTFQLEPGAVAVINIETVNLRAGAGLTFDVVGKVSQGESYPVMGISDDQEWYQILTPEGLEGWLFANLVEIEGDLSAFGITDQTPPETEPTPPPTGPITPTATIEDNGGPVSTPVAQPVRPPRAQFNARELYDNMVNLQFVMVQLRGVLDRRAGAEVECEEYIDYYQQVVQIQTYRNVPEDWTKIHNLYVNSAGNTLDTNRAIYQQCLEGGGQISPFNYRNARNGIDFSLERLRLGLIGAEDRLGPPAP